MGSGGGAVDSWKNIEVTGQTTLTPVGSETLEFVAGTGITITTNALSTPKKITITAAGGSATSYRTDFDNTDLASGILTVTHSLAQKYVLVQVYNNSDKMIIPDNITLTNTNSLSIDLGSFGTIAGTWNVVVIA
jgi:hypothetical protein